MIRVLGIPFDANSSYLQGPALGPDRIRYMHTCGSANAYSEQGVEVKEGENYVDLGNITFHNDDPQSAYETIKQRVTQEIAGGQKLISLGGDHSISYPVIEAFYKEYGPLHVLHFDAHADIYENFENNPYSHASPFARLLEKECLSSLTQVGIRTLTAHQKDQIQKYGVQVYEMKDVTNWKIDPPSSPLYLSIDLDVLDPAFAPGVSHIEPGGISSRHLIEMLHQLNVPIVGADLVELNPTQDVNDMTAMIGYKILKELIGMMG